MSNIDSVTQWINKLKDGHQDGAQNLWARYIERLIRLANEKLAHAPRRMADEEDVAICAFEAFLRGVEAGRFSQLDDRNDLWQILVMLSERRAVDQIRVELTERRGGGHVRGDSALGTVSTSGAADGFDQLAAAEPAPDFAVQASEELRRLLRQLDDDELQRVAVAKMEAYTNAEIAEQLGKSVSSIERKLSLIRAIWGEETES